MPNSLTAQRSVQDHLARTIEEQLLAEKRRINDEIRCYPPPIPACDAQFNYLLEQRSAVGKELGQLRILCADKQLDQTHLCDFIASSAIFRRQAKANLLALVTNE